MHTPDHKSGVVSHYLPTEADTLALGARLAGALQPGTVLHLSGHLGAGKTTLARGILRGLGYPGRVKSPTFSLVELYKFSRLYLYHFDFYRFENPRELADAGFRECFNPESVCLVEWPEKAGLELPAADVAISLQVQGTGRRVEISANTEAGRRCVEQLEH